jgi:hypothetical protein
LRKRRARRAGDQQMGADQRLEVAIHPIDSKPADFRQRILLIKNQENEQTGATKENTIKIPQLA